MKTVVFTLCSNNYMAHAKTLGDSVRKVQPDADFVIGLVDKKHPDVDYRFFEPYEIIPYDEIGYPFFDEMIAAYNVIEFNTAVKPYYYEFLFNRYGENSRIFYIDPDIVLYENLAELNQLLDVHNMILTPHLTVATPEVTTDEIVALRHGHYNLGFLGLKYNEQNMQFLKWWQSRLRRHCIIDKPMGLFVDQKWMNLAPLYFEGVYLFKHQGYNMAWWNLSERILIKNDGKYFVNDIHQPLVFFHFSGYKPGSSTYFGRTDISEYSFETRKDLVDIFKSYEESLLNNDYKKLWALKPLLSFAQPKPVKHRKLKAGLKAILKSLQK